MSEDLKIELQFGQTIRNFFYSQLFVTPPHPGYSFANQVVIVTGSNTGLGLEASRHFYRLKCAKLILAVRTVSKGEAAKEDIVASVKDRTDADAIEVWPLDLESTDSTLAFVNRAKELSRIDILVENAGINTLGHWDVTEGFEKTVQVNVLNTFLLAMSLRSKLQETKKEFPDSSVHLVIVSSEVHRFTKFPELSAPDLYEALNDQETSNARDRYNVTKLMEVLFVRELVSRLKAQETTPPVIIDMVNPGLCASSLVRDAPPIVHFLIQILRPIFIRTTEVGSRTLVHAAAAGPESHGEFMSDGKNEEVEKWIYGETGKKAQQKVFEQTMKILEKRSPGLGAANGV